MRNLRNKTRALTGAVLAAVLLVCLPGAAMAQDQEPPFYSPEQLDQIVARVALYPDSLLAQVLAAATYADQIPDAARWADEHHYLRGDQLANAINGDQLPFDPSVQALLPFPTVLDTMASDMNWTSDLGNAFLGQRQDVMDAVQRERQRARDYGYLRSNGQVAVSGGPYVTIMPVNPAFVVVPYYDPRVVYYRPRPGLFVGGAINFGFGVSIGAAFRPWGWGVSRFDWRSHGYYVDDHPWGRTWVNRRVYVHPYAGVRRWDEDHRGEERHELIRRDEHERDAWRDDHRRGEEHHHPEHPEHPEHRPH